jgi:hypothetical protein
MMNGSELNGELGVGQDTSSLIADVMKRNGFRPAQIYRELFLMTVSRIPSDIEIRSLEQVRNWNAGLKIGDPPAKGKGPVTAKVAGAASVDDISYYRDVFWALLNSGEFMLNH